jgi:hypothetical protein
LVVEHWIRRVVPRGSVRYLVDEDVGWAYMGELSSVVRLTNAGAAAAELSRAWAEVDVSPAKARAAVSTAVFVKTPWGVAT